MTAATLDHEQLQVAGILYGAEWDARDAALAEARAWLDAHYPDNKNPLAYW